LAVDEGSNPAAHADEQMCETGMVSQDVLGQIPQTVFERLLHEGILSTDSLWIIHRPLKDLEG
jgi:hypothetical protein